MLLACVLLSIVADWGTVWGQFEDYTCWTAGPLPGLTQDLYQDCVLYVTSCTGRATPGSTENWLGTIERGLFWAGKWRQKEFRLREEETELGARWRREGERTGSKWRSWVGCVLRVSTVLGKCLFAEDRKHLWSQPLWVENWGELEVWGNQIYPDRPFVKRLVQGPRKYLK